MDNLQLSQGGSFNLASGALATATTTSKVKTTANITYTIDGQFYALNATDNHVSLAYTGATVYTAPTGVGANNGTFTGATGGSTRLFGIYLDSTTAASVVPGPIVNTGELTAGTAQLHWPPAVKGKCCIGAVRVALTAGTTFVPGTTLLGASGVTATYYNLSSIPGEPLTA